MVLNYGVSWLVWLRLGWVGLRWRGSGYFRSQNCDRISNRVE